MKTALFCEPGKIRIEEVSQPIAGQGEIVIKNKIALTFGTDLNFPMAKELYTPYHPAVLRLVRQVIENGHKSGNNL